MCVCIGLGDYVVPIALAAEGLCVAISLGGYCVVPILRRWRDLVL